MTRNDGNNIVPDHQAGDVVSGFVCVAPELDRKGPNLPLQTGGEHPKVAPTAIHSVARGRAGREASGAGALGGCATGSALSS